MIEAFGHALEGAVGTVHRRYSLGCDMEEAFRTPAAFWRGIAATGFDVAFRLQTIKGGINCAD